MAGLLSASAQQVVSAFDGLTDDAAIWDRADALVRDMGGCALTVGVVQRPRMQPVWARSSMDPAFLSTYADQGLFDHDPFIQHFRASTTPVFTQPGTMQLDAGISGGARQLDQALHDVGYRFLYGVGMGHGRAGACCIVTFCSENAADAGDVEKLARVRLTLTVIGAHVGPPEQPAADFTAPMRQ